MRSTQSRKALMAEGALMAYLAPRLALDAKVNLAPVFDGVTDDNFGQTKAAMLDRLRAATKGKFKLATDERVEGAEKMLEEIDKKEPKAKDSRRRGKDSTAKENGEGEEDDDDTAMDAEMAAGWERIKDKLKGNDEAEPDIEAMDAFMKGCDKRAADRKARDELPEEKAKREEAEEARRKESEAAAAKDRKSAKDSDKKAMDEAISTAVSTAVANERKNQRDTHAALDDVRSHPQIGRVSIACDSAEDVYKSALDILGVPTKGLHPSAFKPIFDANRKSGERRESGRRIAADSASGKSLGEMFPDAARLLSN